MLRTALLRKLAVCILILAIGNFLASVFYWYTTLWWLDIAAHMLGGMSVMYAAAVVLANRYGKPSSAARYVWISALIALGIGLLWEGFEYYLYTHYGGPRFSPIDALSDVCFDLAGIWIAGRSVLSRMQAIGSSR